MAAPETTQEPTMEEILASIRRIISEEDQPAAAAPPPVDDILELTSPVPVPTPAAPAPAAAPQPMAAAPLPQEPEMPPMEDLDVIDVVETDAAPMPAASLRHGDLEDGLVGAPAMESALGSLGRLAAAMPIADNPNQTIEGLVQEMLRPMLKQWLDANLPRIVEEKVEAEIVRMSRVVRRAR